MEEDTKLTKPEWNKEFRSYNGLKYSADSADCSIPMSFDSHSGCSFNCLFCFTKNLMRNPNRNEAKACKLKQLKISQTQWDIKKFYKLIRHELHNEWTKSMYPLMDNNQPIQFGSLGDPFDAMEEEFEWSYRAIPFLNRFKQPTRISTKGGDLLCTKKYLDMFEGLKYIWVNFSMITPDDEAGKKIEHLCPLPSKRYEAMKELSDRGIPTCLRYRPIIPELAKKLYKGEPQWKVMLDKASEAGAKGISYEVIFLDKGADSRQRRAYDIIGNVSGNTNFVEEFNKRSISAQACRRTTRFYKHGLMMNIHDYAKLLGLTIGISDPHFKEMGETPCCCGIREDDKIFGNFSKQCMTTIVIEGRKAYEKNGDNLRFTFDDWSPDWAKKVRFSMMCSLGSAEAHKKYGDCTWYDNLRNKWNMPKHFRSPYYYFEGILHPVDVDDCKNTVYEYRDWVDQILDDRGREILEMHRYDSVPLPVKKEIKKL